MFFFLIWYFLSFQYYKEKLFLPVSGNIVELGWLIFEIFEREFEYAPENERLNSFLKITQEEEDFYKLRYKMEWLSLNSYLFHFNGLLLNEQLQEMIEDEKDQGHFQENLNKAVYELRDIYVNTKVNPLLALKGKDWLAAIVGENHSMYNDIRNISEKKTGYFLYQGEDDGYLYFQHIATDTLIPVTKKSMDSTPELKKGETIVWIGFINWKDEWWFTGIYSMMPYNADLILDEKKLGAQPIYF